MSSPPWGGCSAPWALHWLLQQHPTPPKAELSLQSCGEEMQGDGSVPQFPLLCDGAVPTQPHISSPPNGCSVTQHHLWDPPAPTLQHPPPPSIPTCWGLGRIPVPTRAIPSPVAIATGGCAGPASCSPHPASLIFHPSSLILSLILRPSTANLHPTSFEIPPPAIVPPASRCSASLPPHPTPSILQPPPPASHALGSFS